MDQLKLRKSFEAILLGARRNTRKEDLAREALEILDRVDRAIGLHRPSGNDHLSCPTCHVSYPCATVRALTGE